MAFGYRLAPRRKPVSNAAVPGYNSSRAFNWHANFVKADVRFDFLRDRVLPPLVAARRARLPR
jgi:hypothetical protein